MASKSFSASIKAFKKDTMDAVSQVFRKTALDLLGGGSEEKNKGVIGKTKVETGLARGNWQVGVGVKPSEELDRKTKGPQGPRGNYVGALSDFDPEKETPIYIINHVNYIAHLEFGTDKRAGDHMVARTVEEFLADVLKHGGRVSIGGSSVDLGD